MHRPLNITVSRFGTDFKRGDEKMPIYIKPKIQNEVNRKVLSYVL